MTPCAVAVTSSWIELLLLVFIDLPLLEIANIGPASGADGDGMLWTYIQEMCVSVICTRPESYYKCLLEVVCRRLYCSFVCTVVKQEQPDSLLVYVSYKPCVSTSSLGKARFTCLHSIISSKPLQAGDIQTQV